MRSALSVLPVLAAVFAAVDSVLVRRALPHRPVEARLFFEAALLWGIYALLALVPTALTVALLRRLGPGEGAVEGRPRSGAMPALVLAFWTLFPVLGHAALDAFTSTGQNVSALKSPAPWLALGGTAVALLAGLWVLRFALARVGGGAFAALALVVALPAGLLLPLSDGPSAAGTRSDAEGRPNLLLLVWDTCRADHTAPYGYGRETTPHLRRFAEESLVFEEARSVSVFTFTSHLSMLTGVLPSTHGARLLRTRYDPRKATMIAERLGQEGYRTGAFVGTDVLAGRTGIRHGFEAYGDRVDPHVCDTSAWKLLHDIQSVVALAVPALGGNGRPHWFQDFQRPAPGVLAEAQDWIEQDDPRPWFCMINLYDIHWPYLPGDDARDKLVREYNGALDGFLFRANGYDKSYRPNDDDKRHIADLYDAELLELDQRVHDFLQSLPLDRTAVLVTSDHGEAFGEAGTWKHEHIFEPQLRIPWLLRLPGAERSGRVTGPVSGIDVAPTLYGLAGVTPPEGTEGLDVSSGEIDPARLVQVEDRDHLEPTDVRLALYQGPWKLVRRGLGEEASFYLHDLRTDPVGEVNLAAEHPDRYAELRALLEELRGDLDEVEAAAAVEFGGQADALEALGYLGD
ncbi:MAG: sulfatase [Planctomycetota bacterium]